MINKIKDILKNLPNNIENNNITVWKGDTYEHNNHYNIISPKMYPTYVINFIKVNKRYNMEIILSDNPNIWLEECIEKKGNIGTRIKIPFVKEDHPEIEELCYKLYITCKKFIENEFSKISVDL